MGLLEHMHRVEVGLIEHGDDEFDVAKRATNRVGVVIPVMLIPDDMDMIIPDVTFLLYTSDTIAIKVGRKKKNLFDLLWVFGIRWHQGHVMKENLCLVITIVGRRAPIRFIFL